MRKTNGNVTTERMRQRIEEVMEALRKDEITYKEACAQARLVNAFVDTIRVDIRFADHIGKCAATGAVETTSR